MDTSSVKTPFLLAPAAKDYLWGGSRLKDEYSKETDLSPLAETWECSTHPDGPSVIASGSMAGLFLGDVLALRPEFRGTHCDYLPAGELPILIKLIDAKRDLSVQVHPDDAYAFEHENGQKGKIEMWYVLDATRDAKLVYGFQHDMDKSALRKSLESGSVERFLNKVPVKKDNVFFVEPGQVHAIGAGTLVAEIQESSNLTYRMFDYNRVGKDGRPRELHIDKALDVVDLKGSADPRQPMRTLNFVTGYATELLGRCRYFKTERMILNTERSRRMASLRSARESFIALLCIDGGGTMFWERNYLPFFKGDCIFIPADSEPIQLHGKAMLLKVTC